MNPMLDQMSDDELRDYYDALCQISEARTKSRRIGVSGLTDEELEQLMSTASGELYWRNRRGKTE